MSNYNTIQRQIKLLEIKLTKFQLYEQEIRTNDPTNYTRLEDCQQAQTKLKTKITYWTSMIDNSSI